MNRYTNRTSILSKATTRSAFSLVELAIVVAIIGFLLVSIIGGYNLVRTAELRRSAVEFTDKITAIDEFAETYGYLPGDLPTASDFWGTYDAGPPITGAHNGDSNTYVDSDEDLYVWRHLALAELIAGSYTGVVVDGSTRFGLDTNAPASDIYINALYRFYFISTAIYGDRGHGLKLGTLDGDGLPENGVLTAKDAYSLDVKLDDGLAESGMFVALNDSGTCTSSNVYSLSSTTTSCNLLYWYKKY